MSRRIDCRGSFELPHPPEATFPLFTPLGEIDWVPGWAPDFIYPVSGELEENQVFTTDVGGEPTFWSVVRLDRDKREVDYLRVVPGSRIARVFVVVEGDRSRSNIHVRYLCTALTDDAVTTLKEFEDGFDAMLHEWRSMTSTFLADKK